MTHFSLIPASYAVLRRGVRRDEVLLLLRRNTGYRDGHWALLAGHVEPGESAYEAAAREAYEEATVRVRVEDLTPLTTYHRTQRGAGPIEQRCDFFFEAGTWTGDPVIAEPQKCADMRWWRLDALPEPISPHERTVLGWLAEGAPPPILTSGF
ncbi:MAG: NUDIX domain-containing protein [Nocardioidaceae bacterium]